MSIIDRAKNAWMMLSPTGTTDKPEVVTEAAGLSPLGRSSATIVQNRIDQRGMQWHQIMDRMRVEATRFAMVQGTRNMAACDPRIDMSHRRFSIDLARGGWVVDSSNDQMSRIGTEFLNRVVNRKARGWIECWAESGDLYLESLVRDGVMVDAYRAADTDSLHYFRNSDRADCFNDNDRAFMYSPQSANPFYLSPRHNEFAGVWFGQMMITHGRFHYRDGQRYGRPMFASARQSHHLLDKSTMQAILMRLWNSAVTRVHVLGGKNKDEIKKYLDAIVPLTPEDAFQDIGTNQPNGVYQLQGTNNLGEIADIEHLQTILMIPSVTPEQLFSASAVEKVTRDTLTRIHEDYYNVLATYNDEFVYQVIEPLLYKVWLSHGILPDAYEFTIRRREKRTVSMRERLMVMDYIIKAKAAGLPLKVAIKMMIDELPYYSTADELMRDVIMSRGSEVDMIGAIGADV